VTAGLPVFFALCRRGAAPSSPLGGSAVRSGRAAAGRGMAAATSWTQSVQGPASALRFTRPSDRSHGPAIRPAT
jgi:hypothetical protein